jgi:hypothetical protein
VEWPGWSRSGRDEESALRALFAYGKRYAQALGRTRLDFLPPEDPSAFRLVERLDGDATTDFGAPGAIPSADNAPIDAAEKDRFEKLLKALWRYFDKVVQTAEGKELQKGPRGGGRDLEKITRHLLDADNGYLSSVGKKREKNAGDELASTRDAVLNVLESAVLGELPTRGPRGGAYWPPRYFVRRTAWHLLDHAWEIEDRVQ